MHSSVLQSHDHKQGEGPGELTVKNNPITPPRSEEIWTKILTSSSSYFSACSAAMKYLHIDSNKAQIAAERNTKISSLFQS